MTDAPKKRRGRPPKAKPAEPAPVRKSPVTETFVEALVRMTREYDALSALAHLESSPPELRELREDALAKKAALRRRIVETHRRQVELVAEYERKNPLAAAVEKEKNHE